MWQDILLYAILLLVASSGSGSGEDRVFSLENGFYPELLNKNGCIARTS